MVAVLLLAFEKRRGIDYQLGTPHRKRSGVLGKSTIVTNADPYTKAAKVKQAQTGR